MEEDLIKNKLPEIYHSIIRLEEDVDWVQIKEDLEELNWLDFDTQLSYDLIISVWKVADRWGVSVLQQASRFKILKVSKVKLPITNFVYNIQDSQEIKMICKESRGKVEEMNFFSCAKNMLYAASEESLPNLVLRIYDIYNEFKQTISQFFIHFDKQLKMEVNTTIAKLLDEVFYNKVLSGFKTRLINEQSTKKIITEFSSTVPSYQDAGTSAGDSPTVITYSYAPSAGYSTNFNDHSVYLRENLYRGELNEENKREGYGKVTFFGGDTYEGYWENDRLNGEGLYIWKIGGKYLGTFSKGSISGIGKRIYPSGNWYCGEFVNGKKCGKGEMMFKNGDKYEGTWEDDFMHGQGMYTWNTGDVFIGKFVKDVREGKGALTTVDGRIIEGDWKDNQLISS